MVELRPAYSWDCPDCGRENFVRGLVPEFSDEDLQDLRDNHGLQPWDTGDFVMMPQSVQCKHCRSVFSAQNFKEA